MANRCSPRRAGNDLYLKQELLLGTTSISGLENGISRRIIWDRLMVNFTLPEKDPEEDAEEDPEENDIEKKV